MNWLSRLFGHPRPNPYEKLVAHAERIARKERRDDARIARALDKLGQQGAINAQLAAAIQRALNPAPRSTQESLPNEKAPEDTAKKLVRAAAAVAAGSSQIFARTFASVRDLTPERKKFFDFCVAVALVDAALLWFPPKAQDRFMALLPLLMEELGRWSKESTDLPEDGRPNAATASCDLEEWISSTLPPSTAGDPHSQERLSLMGALYATWILSNVHKRSSMELSHDQSAPLESLAPFIVFSFQKWWDHHLL